MCKCNDDQDWDWEDYRDWDDDESEPAEVVVYEPPEPRVLIAGPFNSQVKQMQIINASTGWCFLANDAGQEVSPVLFVRQGEHFVAESGTAPDVYIWSEKEARASVTDGMEWTQIIITD